MIDREKVIKGLEEIRDCESIVYGYRIESLEDAIALLKAQEPREMTLEEVQLYENSLTLEVRNAEGDEYNGLHTALHVAELDFNNPPCEVFGISGFEHTELLRDDTYGVDWRCWTARPTEAQREATPWQQ